MASVWSGFATLADPRSGNAQRHKLLDIVTIALVGSICRAESCADFADFARDREPLFREFLELPGGLPSHDTFSRDDRHGRGHRHARRQDHDDPPLLSVLDCDGGSNLRRSGARALTDRKLSALGSRYWFRRRSRAQPLRSRTGEFRHPEKTYPQCIAVRPTGYLKSAQTEALRLV